MGGPIGGGCKGYVGTPVKFRGGGGGGWTPVGERVLLAILHDFFILFLLQEYNFKALSIFAFLLCFFSSIEFRAMLLMMYD